MLPPDVNEAGTTFRCDSPQGIRFAMYGDQRSREGVVEAIIRGGRKKGRLMASINFSNGSRLKKWAKKP